VKELSNASMKALIGKRLEIPSDKVELIGQNPTGD